MKAVSLAACVSLVASHGLLRAEPKVMSTSYATLPTSTSALLETNLQTFAKGDDGQAYWLPPASGDESAGGGGGAAPASPGTSQYSVSPQAFYQGGGAAAGGAAPASFLQTGSTTSESEGAAAPAAATPAQGGVLPNGVPMMPYGYNPYATMPYHGYAGAPYNPTALSSMQPMQPMQPMQHPFSQMVNNGMTHMLPGMNPNPMYGAGQIPLPAPGTAANNTFNPAMYMTPMMPGGPGQGTIPTTYPFGNTYHPDVHINQALAQHEAMYHQQPSPYAHPMFHPQYAQQQQPPPSQYVQQPYVQHQLPGSGLPHADAALPSVYDDFNYHPLNAKLAIPSALPSLNGDAAQQHAAMYGHDAHDLSLSTTLNNVISSGNKNMVPVRLPNGMNMNVPSDELASMPNALPILDLPNAPLLRNGDVASDQWRQRLDQAQANILAQQQQFSSYSSMATTSMQGKEQESEVLQVRLQQLQKSLADAKHAAEMQKEWLDQVARRNAALEVDKHKVNAEAQLAGITMEYQKVRNQDEKLRQDMLKVAAAKEGLMKQAYAFRSVVRSDTQAIKKLMDGGKKDGTTPPLTTTTTPLVTQDAAADKKAEESEKMAIDNARAAAKKVEEADIESSKADEAALKHMESPAFEVPSATVGGSSGGAADGASGPAL